MAELPYFVALRATVAANATATLSYTVARNEGLRIVEWRVVSTGAFSITNIRDSRGFLYGNLSPSVPLPHDAIQRGNSGNVGFSVFPIQLDVEGSVTLYFDVVNDTATTNTIGIYLSCIRLTA